MHEDALKEIARQLRQPHGEHATEVGERMNKGNEEINVLAINTLNVQAHEVILEIGMGNGFFVKDILSLAPAIHYIGCDFSEAMVEAAILYNKDFINNSQAKFFLASADNLPFESPTFNKIFTVNTLYFWENPALVLQEVKRVLKPEGQLLIAIRPKEIMERYAFTQYGFMMYRKEELYDLLNDNGFKITNIIEQQEPDQEINGETIKVASLIVCAEKA
ncbi:class I SAM-dependent methyltransferase [Emticicia sp. BO119]|uniref:class I SAM-dependent methyltransferase n=1 Tax=Emticicia sp. BO119 TaxID=2757768 RepID=UPI0015F0ED4A|nr:class I SAM-dependent methyltransferase [Emticicia sp. BO119]MBA4850651.1 class I SAM-dependent methyltransferase [Emticicia sp. BO119]